MPSSRPPHVVSVEQTTSSPFPRNPPRQRTRRRARLESLLLTMGLIWCDVLAVNGAFASVYLASLNDIRASGLMLPENPLDILISIVLSNIAFAFSFFFSGLYSLRRGASRVDEAYKVFTAISLATALTLVISALLPRAGYTGLPWLISALALAWGAAIAATILLRSIHRSEVIRLRKRGIDTRRALIVGAGAPGLSVWHTIRRLPELGYRVQGFLSDVHPVGTMVEGLPVLGRVHQLERVVRITNSDEIVLAISKRSNYDPLDILALADANSVSIKVYPDAFHLMTNNDVSIGDLSGLPLISVRNAALDNPLNQALKRALDILLSATILVLTSPLLLLLAWLIVRDSPGPVFFLQERVGLDNRPFYMIKFRTMRTDAESRGPGWTVPQDPRVTRVGAFLRRYSLDELPQFINVLLGEMSIVGPRPEQPKWVEHFSQQIPRYMRRHREKAGITGWAQVNGLRGDTSIEERTRYDLYYIENWSLLFDIKIILRTTLDILTGKQENAY
jgi:exopolysaccharide biosynthesis polyprenyl glycosylphosphotransferase